MNYFKELGLDSLADKIRLGLDGLADKIRFYLEYLPKFAVYLYHHNNIKRIWRDFMHSEVSLLRMEVYALKTRRLNEKHGDFNKEHPLYGGVTKAMEIIPATVNPKKTDKDFQDMVDSKTKPFLNKASASMQMVKEEEGEVENERRNEN